MSDLDTTTTSLRAARRGRTWRSSASTRAEEGEALWKGLCPFKTSGAFLNGGRQGALPLIRGGRRWDAHPFGRQIDGSTSPSETSARARFGVTTNENESARHAGRETLKNFAAVAPRSGSTTAELRSTETPASTRRSAAVPSPSRRLGDRYAPHGGENIAQGLGGVQRGGTRRGGPSAFAQEGRGSTPLGTVLSR